MKRKIVHIEEEKCNGCGLCVKACHEGAIEMIDGKARLVSDEYCDGLGDCLPECPTGAISIIERESKPFDEEAVKLRMQARKEEKKAPLPCGCPGTAAQRIKREQSDDSIISSENKNDKDVVKDMPSELAQWPVQLKLINTGAGYLDDAHILVAADCTAYAYANFHKDFIKDRITIIGCPKLDDNVYYTEKITEILKKHNIKSLTVVRMEVPCCGGIVNAVKTAMLNAQVIVPYREVVIMTDGRVKE